jgi:hypothetical protein
MSVTCVMCQLVPPCERVDGQGSWRGPQVDGTRAEAREKWVPLLCEAEDFKGVPRFQQNRVKPRALAMTAAGFVKLWEIWGHQERPKATAEGLPQELPPELFAPLERRMSTSSRSAYATVHVPMPEHRVHRPGQAYVAQAADRTDDWRIRQRALSHRNVWRLRPFRANERTGRSVPKKGD